MWKTIAALALAVPLEAPTAAHESGTNSNAATDCDRACLYAMADDYLAALVKKDPSRLPWADHVVFTDNNVQLEIGDGTWNTVDGKRYYDLKFADPRTGQVAWFGVIEEHGVPAIMALRLAIEGGEIAEVEQVVTRKVENSPFPSIETYVTPRPIMLADVPMARRTARARMISLADGYFDTIQLNDGTILTKFSDDCERIENGLQTTHNEGAFPNYPIAAFGCQGQFEKLRHTLRHDPKGIDKVIRSLVHLRDCHRRSKKIKAELKYFRRNRSRMKYATMAKRNLPIGSGVTEAACKTLVTQRMKRSGMRWRHAGGQAILTLRGWAQSERFDRGWALLAETYKKTVALPNKVTPLPKRRLVGM